MTPFGKQLQEHLLTAYAPKQQLFSEDYGQGPGHGGTERTITGPDERSVSPAPQQASPVVAAVQQSFAPPPPSGVGVDALGYPIGQRPATPAAKNPNTPQVNPGPLPDASVADPAPAPEPKPTGPGIDAPSTPSERTVTTAPDPAADWQNHGALYAANPNPAPPVTPATQTDYPDQYAAQAATPPQNYYQSQAFRDAITRAARSNYNLM